MGKLLKATPKRQFFGNWELRIIVDKNNDILNIFIINNREIKFVCSEKPTEPIVKKLASGLAYVEDNTNLTEEQMYKHLSSYASLIMYEAYINQMYETYVKKRKI